MMTVRYILVALFATFCLVTGISVAQELALNHDIAMGGQTNWKWCSKCEGLHYVANALGVCPAGGTHDDAGTNLMLIKDVPSADGQHGWRLCSKCTGLFHEHEDSKGVCPAGDAHDSTGSGDYCLAFNSSKSAGQHNWWWCYKCRGLFYEKLAGDASGSANLKVGDVKSVGLVLSGDPNLGVCPAGEQHDRGSTNYTVFYVPQSAVLCGKVTDSAGKSVADAIVEIKGGTGTKKTKTAPDGSFGFTGLGNGKYTIEVTKK
ncbi:MAG: carboxypeptidase-like regulatory domain-containing protein [Acidobacteriota bacterium]